MSAIAVFLLIAVPVAADLIPGPAVAEAESLPVVGDVDGNGLDDLIYRRHALLNLGNAQFTSVDLNLEGEEGVVASLDLNGDRRADLLTAERNRYGMLPASYRVYVADEHGRYRAVSSIETAIPGGRFVPFIADVDSNGNDDLVLIGNFSGDRARLSGEVKILLSRGDGTFKPLEGFRIGGGSSVVQKRLAAGDLNRDGSIDIVLNTNDRIIVLRGLGDGRFAAEHHYFPSSPLFHSNTPALADIDGDRNLDLVMDDSDRLVHVLFGDGEGGFSHHAWHYVRERTGARPPSGGTSGPTIAVGEFVERRRDAIAAVAPEGDVVLLAWRQGALREIDREPSPLLSPAVYAGSFFQQGHRDLFVTWNRWSNTGPRPANQFFMTAPADTENAVRTAAPRGRTRASGRTVTAQNELVFRFEPQCMPLPSIQLVPFRGMFGEVQIGDELLEAVLFDGAIYFRLVAPWLEYPLTGALIPDNGGFAGSAATITACGATVIRVTATPR